MKRFIIMYRKVFIVIIVVLFLSFPGIIPFGYSHNFAQSLLVDNKSSTTYIQKSFWTPRTSLVSGINFCFDISYDIEDNGKVNVKKIDNLDISRTGVSLFWYELKSVTNNISDDEDSFSLKIVLIRRCFGYHSRAIQYNLTYKLNTESKV